MKELLIFDFDGLLVDTERVYFDGWLALFKKYQLPITAADIFGWRGQSWQQTASKLANNRWHLQNQTLCERNHRIGSGERLPNGTSHLDDEKKSL